MKHLFHLCVCLLSLFAAQVQAQTQPSAQSFDLSRQSKAGKPFFFSVAVPDGNYRVTMELGSKRREANTMVRAESRRLFIEDTPTKRGKFKTVSFIVNKRSPMISDKERVKLKPGEKNYLDWDDSLNLEITGPRPAVRRVTITSDTTAVTLFLCGNSTVVDQPYEPYASWGQMITRWMGEGYAVSNLAESGLTATSFYYQKRLDKILAMLRPGDYVFCEFGHNDQKEKNAGSGAWYNFSYMLKTYIDMVRAKGGQIIFVTPTQRRRFDNSHQHILETHGDYPDAMRAVAKREHVPVIELHDMTRTFFEALGYEGSKRALVHYPMGTWPGQTKPLADNTHFNPYGAYEVAKMVVMGMKALNLPPVQSLRDWTDFNPAHPDDIQHFHWTPSTRVRVTKPDGN